MPVTLKDIYRDKNTELFHIKSLKPTGRSVFFKNQLQGDITAVGGFDFSSSPPCVTVVHVLAQEDSDDS